MSKFRWMLLGLMLIKLLFRMKSFCSDIVAQNVNVISSPTCKVLCFKKHHRISPNKFFVLETSPFAVTPSTKLPLSSPISPPSSSLLSLSSSSSSTSPSSPLWLNPPSSPSSSVSFYISSTSEFDIIRIYLCFFYYLFFIICWL